MCFDIKPESITRHNTLTNFRILSLQILFSNRIQYHWKKSKKLNYFLLNSNRYDLVRKHGTHTKQSNKYIKFNSILDLADCHLHEKYKETVLPNLYCADGRY